MKKLVGDERTCGNCVHERDSGTEFCGPCLDSDQWQEDSYHLEKRADAEIAALRKENEGLRQLERDAYAMHCSDSEECVDAAGEITRLKAALIAIRGRVYVGNGEVLGFDGITGVKWPGVEAAKIAHEALTPAGPTSG